MIIFLLLYLTKISNSDKIINEKVLTGQRQN